MEQPQAKRNSWFEVEVGDVVGKRRGFYTPSEPVKVVHKARKYLTLENGARISMEAGAPDYELWDPERNAQRAANGRRREIKRRLAVIQYGPSVYWNEIATLSTDDFERDAEALLELEKLVERFKAERDDVIARVLAKRAA